MTIHILCKKGSASSRILSEKTGFPRVYWQGHLGKPKADITGVVNWGVYGPIRRKVEAKYPDFPIDNNMINSRWPGNKYEVAKELEAAGVPVKPTAREIDLIHAEDCPWVYKGYSSAGGKQVMRITPDNVNDMDWGKGYAQQEVTNRKYEVRVSAFKWLPDSRWLVWKKIQKENPDKLAWNHEQGAKFVRVANPKDYDLFNRLLQHSRRALEITGLDFGAIDFIVGPTWDEYFLEINTQPGFTEDYGANDYAKALEELNNIPMKDWKKFYEKPKKKKVTAGQAKKIENHFVQGAPMDKLRMALQETLHRCINGGMALNELIDIVAAAIAEEG